MVAYQFDDRLLEQHDEGHSSVKLIVNALAEDFFAYQYHIKR